MVLSGGLDHTHPCKTRRNKQEDAMEHPLHLQALCEHARMSFSTNHSIILCSSVHFSFLQFKRPLGLGFLKLHAKTVS